MPDEVELPDGRYMFVVHGIPPNYGGLTRSMFARAAAFSRCAGRRVSIVTFDEQPDVELLRAGLRSTGALIPGVDLLNLFEHYATKVWPQREPLAPRAVENLSGLARVESVDHRGRVWRATYEDSETSQHRYVEYLRADGSVYLRRHIRDEEGGGTATALVECVDHRGDVVETHPTVPALYRRWIQDLAAEGGTAFLVVDGPASGRHLLSIAGPGLYVFLAVHNAHLKPGERLGGELDPLRAYMFAKMDRVDGLILLTRGQAADVEARWGRRNNIFVVSHAARPLTAVPDPARRAPYKAVMIARLAVQKRVEHAIEAFRRVVDELPSAQLEIYGDGPEKEALLQLRADLGLQNNVAFPGHVPDAPMHFRTARLALLTSAWEGQGLVILEAMSAACPTVAYDIPYGPSDLITDSVDGRLVPAGDVEGLGRAILEVMSDPAHAESMGHAAWKRAQELDEKAMVRSWDCVFRAAVANRERRTALTHVSLSCEHVHHEEDSLTVGARLAVSGVVPLSARDDVRLTWLLVSRETEEQIYVPATVTRADISESGATFDVGGRLDLRQAAVELGRGTRVVDVSLELLWNNSHRRLRVQAPRRDVEAYVTKYGNLSFHSGPPPLSRATPIADAAEARDAM